jgi:hypothetical protein
MLKVAQMKEEYKFNELLDNADRIEDLLHKERDFVKNIAAIHHKGGRVKRKKGNSITNLVQLPLGDKKKLKISVLRASNMPKLTKISTSIITPDVGINRDGGRRFNSMNIDSEKRIPRQPMLDVNRFQGKHF